jgi:hypothetical protein
MTTKDQIITMTSSSLDNFFKYARAVPEDKLSWKPAEGSRTVLDLAQECAQSADWAPGMIKAGGFSFDEEAMNQMREERAGWTTVEACERVCRERTEGLFEAIRAFPEEKLHETIELPFGKKTFAWWEIMLVHNWNLTYHLGQVAYVQTLYGDQGYY